MTELQQLEKHILFTVALNKIFEILVMSNGTTVSFIHETSYFVPFN